MDDYLTKPMKVKDLLAMIDRLVVRSTIAEEKPAGDPAESSFEDRVLHDRFDGDLNLLRIVAGTFLETTPPLLSDMREAIAAGDAGSVSRIAHRFRGSLANFGADEAVEAALQLEKMGAEGDLAGADAACETLIEGYETLRVGLDRLLSPSPPSAASRA
jgi:HPt (histidine-containing phosphotransfer) domain-containing protein